MPDDATETPNATPQNEQPDASVVGSADGSAGGSTGADAKLSPGLLARCGVGGALMGLANLVPGISGGTMLVAAGVYERFIDAIGDVTRLKLKPAPIAVLGVVVLAAVVAIGGLAGVVSLGLAEFRWGMYSLFIGLTLGGVPIMLRLARPMTPGAWGGLVGGVVCMLALVVLQSLDVGGGSGSSNAVMLFIGGVAGASAMILPGVSGAYLLLLLGQYEPIIAAIKDTVSALKDADVGAVMAQLGVIVPVGLGVVAGVVVVSNILKFVLHRYEKATLGVLLGLLVAAPAGLYPFKQGVPPEAGDTVDGVVVTEDNLEEFDDPKDWNEAFFTPGVVHVAGSLGLIALGIGATWGLGVLGRDRTSTTMER
ncbi:MAG: DUF368 domain-containing protein [Planctomycetota bacterium]